MRKHNRYRLHIFGNNEPDCDPGGDFSEAVIVVALIPSLLINRGDIFVSSSTAEADKLSVVLSISSIDRLLSRLRLLLPVIIAVVAVTALLFDEWFVLEYDADCDKHAAKLGVDILAFVKLLKRSVEWSLLLLQYPYQPSSSFIADSAYS